MHTLHTLRIPEVLLILLFLATPAFAAGMITPGSSFHIIDIEHPDIISPEITWQKCLKGPIPSSSYIIQQTSDGGYIMVGRTDSNATDADLNYWIVKLSSGGDIGWQKSLRGTQKKPPLTMEQTDTCGYRAGERSGSPEGNTTANKSMLNSWIQKFTHEGEISWEKSLGNAFQEEIRSIQQTADGGYILGGSAVLPDNNTSLNRRDRDCWIAKLTSSGDLSWKKTLGGTKDDLAYRIRQTADGGYIIGGASASNDGDVTGNHGDLDYWIVKLTPGAEISWEKSLGGSNRDQPYDIQQLADGGYIIAGASASNDGDVSGNHGDSDYWIVKLTPAGKTSWQKSFGGKAADEANSIRQTNDGGYIVAGESVSRDGDVTGNHGDADYWIVKLATDGNLRWEKSLGGSRYDSGQSILQTNDGGYIIAGITYSDDGDITGNRERLFT
ncbi:MAG: secretion protein [Methanomicrobiales archaeon HGW-Methanomicrobiales-4]|nr:MAG: secretion protein [Methanomicrobiales archaeon HGW-Methanomicrobiales-4]